VAMMNIEDSNHFAASNERNREQRLVSVFYQRGKRFETRVRKRFAGEGDDRLMLGDPARYSFTHAESYLPNFCVVGQLRGAQHNVTGAVVRKINQTCVTRRDFDGYCDQLTQHLVDAQSGADDSARAMQDGELPRFRTGVF